MDQRADASNQQNETDRQRIDEEVRIRAESGDGYPGEEVLVDSPPVAVLADQADEQRHGEHE